MHAVVRLRADRPRTAPRRAPTNYRGLVRVAALASLALGVVGTVGWSIHRRQVDVEVYLMGARHLTSAHLYDQYLAGVHLPFTYPPFAALVMWPLTWFDVATAQVVWALVNLAALVGLLAFSLWYLRPDDRDATAAVPWTLVALLIGPAVLLEPVMLDVSFGQINLLLVLLVLVDATSTLSVAGRDLPRGAGVGIAAAIKLVPALFVVFFLVTRQFRAAMSAAVTFVTCAALAAVVTPSASRAFWTHYVNDQRRIGSITYVSNQSLEGALERVTHHAWSSGALIAVQGATVIIGLVAARRLWRSSSNFWSVLVVADTGLLASPISWAHHLVWIVPVLAWLWWGEDRPVRARWWAVGGAALFFVAPMWRIAHGPPFDSHEHGASLVAGNSFTLAALVFLGWSFAWAHREVAERL